MGLRVGKRKASSGSTKRECPLDPITVALQKSVIGFSFGEADAPVYNIEKILAILCENGIPRDRAIEVFYDEILRLDDESVFVWPN